MPHEWKSLRHLAEAVRRKARAGKNVVLSPETALAVAEHLDGRPPSRGPDRLSNIDAFTQGSAVYRLYPNGERAELIAFASSALVARAAFDYVCERYPEDSFSQRRRAWVEAERIVQKKKR
jgi:hypothetical protein